MGPGLRNQLALLQGLQRSFDTNIAQAGLIAPSAAKAALVQSVRSDGRATFDQAERVVLPASGTPRIGAAVVAFDNRLNRVGSSLDPLNSLARTQTAQAEAEARSTADQARVIALSVGGLTVLVTILLIAYVVQLIGRLLIGFDRRRSGCLARRA